MGHEVEKINANTEEREFINRLKAATEALLSSLCSKISGLCFHIVFRDFLRGRMRRMWLRRAFEGL